MAMLPLPFSRFSLFMAVPLLLVFFAAMIRGEQWLPPPQLPSVWLPPPRLPPLYLSPPPPQPQLPTYDLPTPQLPPFLPTPQLPSPVFTFQNPPPPKGDTAAVFGAILTLAGVCGGIYWLWKSGNLEACMHWLWQLWNGDVEMAIGHGGGIEMGPQGGITVVNIGDVNVVLNVDVEASRV